MNRLARGENVDDTIIGVKKRQRDTKVPVSFSHTTPDRQWNEPETTYAARYPYNHVYESESGHIVEFDDTPGKERVHFYHRSGTFVEIHGAPGQEGDTVVKVVGKVYVIAMENAYIHFQNAANITIDGETNIYSRDDVNWQVDGNMNVHVKGNYTEKIAGNRLIDIKGSQTEKIGGADTIEVGGNHSMHAGGISDRHSGGAMYDIAGGQIKQSAGGTFVMASGGNLSADAPRIDFNSGRGSTSSPSSPKSPVVPAFPDPLGRKESRFETGSDPQVEEKEDPNPASFGQDDC